MYIEISVVTPLRPPLLADQISGLHVNILPQKLLYNASLLIGSVLSTVSSTGLLCTSLAFALAALHRYDLRVAALN